MKIIATRVGLSTDKMVSLAFEDGSPVIQAISSQSADGTGTSYTIQPAFPFKLWREIEAALRLVDAVKAVADTTSFGSL